MRPSLLASTWCGLSVQEGPTSLKARLCQHLVSCAALEQSKKLLPTMSLCSSKPFVAGLARARAAACVGLRTRDDGVGVAVRGDLARAGVAAHDLRLHGRILQQLPQLRDAAAIADGDQRRPKLLHLRARHTRLRRPYSAPVMVCCAGMFRHDCSVSKGSRHNYV